MNPQHSRESRVLWTNLQSAEPLLKAVVNTKVMEPRSDVLREGDIPTMAHVLLEGHTYRYRMLADGRRQITAVLMPGDVCDLEAIMRGRADYSVGVMTNCILGEIPATHVADLTKLDPEMTQALWQRLLHNEAISREWLVCVGRRSALERVAHLLCEFRVRLEAVGLSINGEFTMRLSQIEFGDILGLSYVHVNRTLQHLRQTGLIAMSKHDISILDIPALEQVAHFDPAYLQTSRQ